MFDLVNVRDGETLITAYGERVTPGSCLAIVSDGRLYGFARMEEFGDMAGWYELLVPSGGAGVNHLDMNNYAERELATARFDGDLVRFFFRDPRKAAEFAVANDWHTEI